MAKSRSAVASSASIRVRRNEKDSSLAGSQSAGMNNLPSSSDFTPILAQWSSYANSTNFAHDRNGEKRESSWNCGEKARLFRRKRWKIFTARWCSQVEQTIMEGLGDILGSERAAKLGCYLAIPYLKSDRQIVSQIVRHESEFLIRRQLPVHGTMYKKARNTAK